MLVDVADDAARVGGHQGVDVRFNQGAGVKLLVAKALVQHRLLGLYPFARGIVGANQQVPNDVFLCVAQGRDRHNGREATAIFANVSQLVNVFNATGSLEHQRFKAWRDGGTRLNAQGIGAGHQLLRI